MCSFAAVLISRLHAAISKTGNGESENRNVGNELQNIKYDTIKQKVKKKERVGREGAEI